MAETLAKELRSFVTFALALKPKVTLHRKADAHGPQLTLEISTNDRLSKGEVASLEPLLAKYKSLKPYLDAILDTDESIATCKPTVNFEPNVHYKVTRISGDQYRIAKEVAGRLDRIQSAGAANDHKKAKVEYDDFLRYLGDERQALLGEFQGVQFADGVASFGASRVADGDCSGAVIFVIIEIFIAFQAPTPEGVIGGVSAE
jgi:hypothetical protein